MKVKLTPKGTAKKTGQKMKLKARVRPPRRINKRHVA